MEDTKVITFRVPIKLGETNYESVTLREPTAGELEVAARATTGIGTVIDLVRLVAKIPRKVVEQIPNRELTEISDFFASFAGPSSTDENDPKNE